ncbi:DUF2235 domain-containing protein [Collimonas pratensis]|uniref:T6SS phospholipase effector Tle1-like catalytic domain-containing protein n=1 Tax=Collimonas pratensis TaxID=279113 RepID=UPI00143DE46E|nr:DUF2235 domain-containing protein [Collimonas pratensis]NKI68181.1 DUF2235 domain-containing protein [Collimonas pratensis]
MGASIQAAPVRIASTAAEEVTLAFDQQVDLAAANHCRKIASCDKFLKVGIFFDGTNNNLQRDKLDIDDRQKQYHSNIARLFESHKDVNGKGAIQADDCYRFYVPGVGTRFEEGQEYRESQDGKAMAKGGQARILYALLEVYNAIHRAFNQGESMFDKSQLTYYIKKYVIDVQTPKSGDEQRYTRPSWFAELTAELDKKIADKRKILPLPHLPSLKVSVFGFSRGAVQARAFCYWFQDMLKDDAIAGIPASISFLGVFDSVATVGLSHSAAITLPIPSFWADGHYAWAKEIKKPLPPCVQKAVHYVAAHEQRMNFPLTRMSGGNVTEVLYPGVHSDIGGGYGCRDQGRAMTLENLLSQVPLLHMFKTALLANVPLVQYEYMSADLQADFQLGPELVNAWNGYMAAAPAGGSYQEQVHQHMQLYYGFRHRWLGNMEKSPGVQHCRQDGNVQDAEDLVSYDKLLGGDTELLSKRKYGKFPGKDAYGEPIYDPLQLRPDKAGLGNFWQLAQYDQKRPLNTWETFALSIVKDGLLADQQGQSLPLLESHVHDSLAGFWMAGYLSAEEKAEGVLKMANEGGPNKEDSYQQEVWTKYQQSTDLQKIIEKKQVLQVKAEEARFSGEIDKMQELQEQSTFTPDEQSQFAALYPLQTDANAPELRNKMITTQTWTLREGGGYFYPRYVFE